MSHLMTLSELKVACDTTGNCTQYHAQLKLEDEQIDLYTASANQAAINTGIIFGIIGLLVLLTPFIKLLQKIQRFTLPKLAVLVPVTVGILAGAFVGFAISFSACYKQQCSIVESSAMFTIPAASLFITVPLTRKINRKRQNMAEGISRPKPLGWIIVGSLILILAIARTVTTINENNRSNISRKEYLRSIEL